MISTPVLNDHCHELFENARDIIYEHDLNGRYVAANKAASELTGYSHEEIMQLRISDVVAPEYLPDVRARLEQKLANPEQTNYEIEVITRSGARLPLEVSSHLVFENGRPVAVQGIARDITARRRLETEREAFSEIIQSVSSNANLDDLLRLIHKAISKVMYAENCFIAICDEDESTLCMEFFVDKYDSPPPPQRLDKGCTAYVLRTSKGALISEKLLKELVATGEVELVGSPSPSWLGVPLNTPAKTIGALVVQHHEDRNTFTERDLHFLSSVAGQIAVAVERKRTEDGLREGEERYRELVENARDILYTHDLQGNFTSCNKAAEEITGYTMEEALKLNFAQVVTPEYQEKLNEMMARVVTGENIAADELEIFAKDGHRIRVEVSTRLVLKDGVPVAITGVARDISERRRTEEALRISEGRYQSLVESNVIGIYIASINGEIKEANDKFLEMMGYRRTELEMGHLRWDTMTPPGWEQEDEYIKQQALTYGFCPAVEKELIHKNGNRVAVRVTVAMMENSKADGITLIEDITERKNNEQELLRLATAVEQTVDTIVITDTSGNIQYVNPAFERNTGYSRAEALGKNPRILKSGKTAPAVYADLWNTISRGDVWIGQLTNQRKDGTLFEERVTISPVRDGSGRIVNYIAVKQDITVQTQLEQQLRQSQRLEAIGQLAGGVAHDFNNLLTAIIGYSDLTLAKLNPEDRVLPNVLEIKKAGTRAAALTRQLLAFSRKQILDPQIIDLNSIVADINKMLRRLIGEDIELITKCSEDLGSVKADPTQIEQVIMNLVVNARDAMPQGGHLVIETHNVEINEDYQVKRQSLATGNYVMLAVSDNGCGMDAETQAHIFEPFFTTKEYGKGTGLGLSTIYGIVKQSGGHIWVYSEPGGGTVFKIYLPRVYETGEAMKVDRTEPIKQGSGLLLLVEDDCSVRAVTAQFLETLGYTVLQTSEGKEALEIVQRYEREIRLVITDVVMPEMGGRELAERLSEVTPELPVLFMSGYTDDAIVRAGIVGKNISFLEKPFTLLMLAKRVSDELEGITGD